MLCLAGLSVGQAEKAASIDKTQHALHRNHYSHRCFLQAFRAADAVDALTSDQGVILAMQQCTYHFGSCKLLARTVKDKAVALFQRTVEGLDYDPLFGHNTLSKCIDFEIESKLTGDGEGGEFLRWSMVWGSVEALVVDVQEVFERLDVGREVLELLLQPLLLHHLRPGAQSRIDLEQSSFLGIFSHLFQFLLVSKQLSLTVFGGAQETAHGALDAC
jgi:hypothetical protein